MKNDFLRILLVILSSLFLQQALAQKATRLSFQFKDTPLVEALSVIEKEYDLSFSYPSELLEGLIISELHVRNKPMEEAFILLLGPFDLDCDIISSRYLLIKARAISDNNVPDPIPEAPIFCATITDGESGEVLGFANVQLKGTTRGASTDREGRFDLKGPFSKKDSILISYVGYISQCLPASVLKQGPPCPTILLEREQLTFEDVLIEDRAIELLRSSANGNGVQFRPDKMDILPGWGDNDVLRMSQLLPGINSTDDSASNLHIRGGTPDQNLILWDGIPIYHTGHFFGMFSAFNPYVVNELDVYRGGFGARHGGRVSGLIDIRAKPEELDSLEGGVGLNLINLHGYIKTPMFKGKSAFLLAFRRAYTDIIQSRTYQNLFDQITGGGKIKEQQQTAEDENINLLLNPNFFFSDVNIKWVFTPSEKSLLSLSVYSGGDDLDYTAGLDLESLNIFFQSRDRIILSNWGLNLQWDQQWGERFSTKLRIMGTEFERDYTVFLTADRDQPYQARFQQMNKMREGNLQMEASWLLNEGQYLNIGYHTADLGVDFDWEIEILQEDLMGNDAEELTGNTNTLFLDYDLQKSDRFKMDLGFRLTHYSENDDNYLEPRLTVEYQPIEDLFYLKLSLGRYVQFVSQMVESNELDLGEELWIMANEKFQVPVITSNQYSFGAWMEKRGWLIDMEYYIKKTNNLTTLYFRNEVEDTPYSVGDSEVNGLDILIKKKWKNLNTWLSYSLANVQYTFPNINNGQSFPASHDQRHTLNFTQSLSLRRWGGSFSYTYGSGRPYTGVRGVGTNFPNEGEEVSYFTLAGDRNQYRLPAYHRADFSIHYKFFGKRKMKGKVGLSIFNLYNTVNIYNREYYAGPPEDNSIEPLLLRVDESLLGATPNIFFNMEW